MAILFNFDDAKQYLIESIDIDLNFRSDCSYNQFFNIGRNKQVKKYTFACIRRWFCYLAENKMLDGFSFRLIVKILSSSGLNVTSELEVAQAVNSWIEHDPKSRSRFTLELIKTVRLPLLSTAALKTLLESETSFSKCEKSRGVVLKAVSDKTVRALDPSFSDCRVRHCAQDDFEVALCGNEKKSFQNSIERKF